MPNVEAKTKMAAISSQSVYRKTVARMMDAPKTPMRMSCTAEFDLSPAGGIPSTIIDFGHANSPFGASECPHKKYMTLFKMSIFRNYYGRVSKYSDTAPRHFLINLGIFPCRLRPPKIPHHSVAHQLFPGLLILECRQRAINRIHQPPCVQPLELEPGPRSLLRIPLLNRVVEPTRCPPYGCCSVLEGVNLVQPARLIPRRH